MSKDNIPFRSWYYFRIGWSTYFAFILAAINTLTVTYFLAIDNYPFLKVIFPSFEIYIIIIITIGIPLLVIVGYSHYKRTSAFRSEADVVVESHPYQRRNTVNAEMNLRLNLKILNLILKLSENEKIKKDQIDDIKQFLQETIEFSNTRSLNNDMDIDFIKKEIRKL